MQSYLLNTETADKAVRVVLPTIEHMMETEMVKRRDLHIVVLDPLGGHIMFARSLGDPAKWEHQYDFIACSKATIAWRAKADTITVQSHRPWMYDESDTPYGGGVYHDGIAVGVSGVQWWFDQMFAEMIASAIKALCIEKMEEKVLPSGYDFIVP